MTTDAEYKQRFLVFAVLRLAGLAVFFLGIAIAFSDLVRPGGWPEVGGIVAVLGAIDAVLAPKLIKRVMEKR